MTMNDLFSTEMMSEINVIEKHQEIIITEEKYETFTKVRTMQLPK